jgi:hypothetical protein
MKARTLLTVALLSVCVFSTAAQAAKKSGGKKAPNYTKLMEKLDANENGTLSADEVAGNKKLSKKFEKMDVDEDGELDLAELEAGMAKKSKKAAE